MIAEMWIAFIAWIVLIFIGLKDKSRSIWLPTAGVIGLIFGISLLTSLPWLGAIFFLLNIGLLYEVMIKEKE